ncbi:unnamed protein product [Auanema sp. JU1783]|nr:unnamed protein product [Auanema sp. JU1783]
MATNEAYVQDPIEIERVTKPAILKVSSIIRMDDDPVSQSTCCSWNGLIDIFGNRQGTFITDLRPLRTQLTWTQQQLTIFTTEIERSNESRELTIITADSVHSSIVALTKITVSSVLNIPPEENAMLRKLACDLCKLYSILASFVNDPERLPSSIRNDSHQALGEIHENEDGKEIRDTGTGGKPFDENALRERINRNSENMEKVIKFIDVKTERRWWLRDVINFAKLFLKLALFVSAAITVIDHRKDTAPVITLSLTIIQGIVEMLDQYFLKHTKPEDLKISAVSTIAFQRRMSQLA